MKNLFLFAALILALNDLAAQGKKSAKVVTRQDTATAASVNVNAEDPLDKAAWKRNGSKKAQFSDTTVNQDRVVTYDATGNTVVSDNRDERTYPSGIDEYYTQTYPGEKFDVWTGNDDKGKKTFFVTRKSEVLAFDVNGKYKSRKNVKSTTK